MEEKNNNINSKEYAKALLELSKNSLESNNDTTLGEILSTPMKRFPIRPDDRTKLFGLWFGFNKTRMVIYLVIIITVLILINIFW
jgi:hypothetical protein